MKDRCVIVTGAAGGIGQELVVALLDAGAGVFAIDRDQNGLDRLASRPELQGHRNRLETAAVDLTDTEVAKALVQSAARRFGPIYGLVNNAGIGRSFFWKRTDRGAKFWEVEAETTRLFLDVNVCAVANITTASVGDMLEAGRGRIVTVTTSFESMLSKGMHPYGPSKAAIEAFAAVAANDLEGTGITSNVVHPGGAVDTPMVLDRPGIPRVALLKPSVMVAPILWLMSDAGGGTTGRRITAHQWDPAQDGEAAMKVAGSSIAWTDIARGTKRKIDTQPAVAEPVAQPSGRDAGTSG